MYSISSCFYWYKNYNNRASKARVIIKNKVARFYGSRCISHIYSEFEAIKSKGRQICIASYCENLTPEALRYGSHSCFSVLTRDKKIRLTFF